MKSFALLLAGYAAVMLCLHLMTSRILHAWQHQPGSWIARRITAALLLRVEALFWTLALVCWFLWQSVPAKLLVMMFALLHLLAWGADEFGRFRKSFLVFKPKAALLRAIVVFDLLEAAVLAGIGIVAIRYFTHAA